MFYFAVIFSISGLLFCKFFIDPNSKARTHLFEAAQRRSLHVPCEAEAAPMLDTPLRNEIERSGFAAPETLIHLFVGGSELHGAKVGATDDLDIYGVFLDAPSVVLGIAPRTHFVWSTASDERRNGTDDVDRLLAEVFLQGWMSMGVPLGTRR
jgi:hypothetical protein